MIAYDPKFRGLNAHHRAQPHMTELQCCMALPPQQKGKYALLSAIIRWSTDVKQRENLRFPGVTRGIINPHAPMLKGIINRHIQLTTPSHDFLCFHAASRAQSLCKRLPQHRSSLNILFHSCPFWSASMAQDRMAAIVVSAC